MGAAAGSRTYRSLNAVRQLAGAFPAGDSGSRRKCTRGAGRDVCRIGNHHRRLAIHGRGVYVVCPDRRGGHFHCGQRHQQNDREKCCRACRKSCMSKQSSGSRVELVRGLGAWASTAIVVGTMIGTGIFLKPAEMAREGRTVAVVFAAWSVGAILSIFGALSYAELGAAIPEAGGEYAYMRRGFGPVWGFLFGWMHSIVGRPASASSIAAGIMRFMGFLIPAVAAPIFTVHIALPGLTGWIKPYDFVFTWAQPLAVAWLLIMTGVNYLGVRLGGAVQVFLTTIKITSVAVVIAVAFFAPASTQSSGVQPFWPAAGMGTGAIFSAFLAALAAALWAYDGWEDLNLVGSEVENPQKNFPRALVGGVGFVAVIYL